MSSIISVYALLLLEQKGNVLLLRRSGTRFGSGSFSLPGGKVENVETCRQALIREAREELNIELAYQELAFVAVIHKPRLQDPFMAVCFHASSWHGQLHNNEPDKHDLMQWYSLKELPPTLLERHARIIELYLAGSHYDEFVTT